VATIRLPRLPNRGEKQFGLERGHEPRRQMKCFTIASGSVTSGVTVEKMRLSGAGVEIDAVLVGESGRGRELGVLPIDPAALDASPCPKRGYEIQSGHSCPLCGEKIPGETMYVVHPEIGTVRNLLTVADVGQTRAGKPKLVREASAAKAADFCLVAFRTKIGFRGGNSHTGDRLNPASADAGFVDFPGEVICRGVIAQGDAGGMGSGEQIVAVMPRGVVFRTGYSGRLYGEPAAHYYAYDGERILSATWAEREASDCF